MSKESALPVALLMFLLGLPHVVGAAQPPIFSFSAADRIEGPDGHWDYASYDPVRSRIYIARDGGVSMIDTDTGRLIPVFARGDHVHAVVSVPGTDALLTTNGGDGTARIISADDGRLLGSLPVGRDPDGAVFDPATGTVVVVDGEAGDLYLVDVKARRVRGTVRVGDALEYPAVDGTGKVFVNIVEKAEVAVVDLVGRHVVSRYPLRGCKRPTGLAYVSQHRLISTCGNNVAKILDAHSGAEIAHLKVGGFPDAVIYDAQRQLAMIPAGLSGSLSVVALSGLHENTVIEVVPTQIGARTGALDTKTGRIYLPTAKYKPIVPGQQPQTEPGTFIVLVSGSPH
jgi:DNA-binding beta-propeller fold protein YncE